MPSATVTGFLDPYGRPYTYNPGLPPSSGNLYRRTADDDRLRPLPPSHFADYLSLLAPSRYRELVTECRSLASRGLVAALLEQKADYVAASHYRARFTGHDEAFGADLIGELESALQICNLRGPRYDWRTTWRLSVPTRATDGSFFILLTTWADTGWPALQALEGHRIGQRDNTATTVGPEDAVTTITDEQGENPTRVRGAYRGLRIHNGIIFNAAGQEVAYRVLGAEPKQDEDISARDLIHIGRPRRFSEGRPVPDLAPAALNFLATDLAVTCQLDQQIEDSKLSLIETNATGKYDAGAAFSGPRNPQATPTGTPTEVIERATHRFIKTGFDVKPHQSSRPSDQWMNFDARVNARGAAALRWRLEMLDPTALRGAATRAFQDQINTAIQDEFQIDRPAAIRVLRYFTAKLIQLGRLPNHEEAFALDIAPPPWFEVDRASARLDLEDVAAGRTAMSTLHGRDGHTTVEVFTARANDYLLAQKVKAAHPGVPLEYLIGNIAAESAQQAAQAEADRSATAHPRESSGTPNASAFAAEVIRLMPPPIPAPAAAAPPITVNCPPVHVHPPTVNVHPAAVHVAPPAVHVAAARAPDVHVAAPIVHVAPATAPRVTVAAPVINFPREGRRRAIRDESGRITATEPDPTS